MVSLLKSEAAFAERAKDNGLGDADLAVLSGQGIKTLSSLAYSLTTPGTSPGEDALRGLLNSADPGSVSLASLTAIRKLMFESQTLSMASLKQVVEHTEDRKIELAPAEREDLTGPYENAHGNYTTVAKMIESDVPVYLEPHKFITRSAEVSRDKPGKEVIIDEQSRLQVKDKLYQDKVAIQSELQLQEAFARRALACDLMGVCTFSVMESWRRFLLAKLSLPPPPNYRKTNMEQLLRTDKAAWVRMAVLCNSLKRTSAGELPLDKAFPLMQTDPHVSYHLVPMPGNAFGSGRGKGGKASKGKGNKRINQGNEDRDAKKGKGKGVPAPLSDPSLRRECSKTGLRICWNYNLKDRACKFAKPGEQCKRGLHCCMKCEGFHPLYQRPSDSS